MATLDSLTVDLLRLGLAPGGVLVLHSGFRALQRPPGGPDDVVAALRRALGPGGTLLAPAFTTNLIDPATWPVPPPPAEQDRLRATLPLFEAATSPPYKMGAIATALWRTPGALRSQHPVTSWVALGPLAHELTREHPQDDPEGEQGPVGRAWQHDAQVLLLGVDHDANTTLHLAESLLDMPHLQVLPDRFPVGHGAARTWVPVRKTTKCSDGFVAFGAHARQAQVVSEGTVGGAASALLRSRDIVRVAAPLLAAEPTALLCQDPTCVHCPTSRRVLATWRPSPEAWARVAPDRPPPGAQVSSRSLTGP